MGKNKLFRFGQNVLNPFVIEEGKPFFDTCKGQWNNNYFFNEHPIILELGCGNGEYTCGLAARFKEKNFIGVDIKGARIWRGASKALTEKLYNTAFLRTRIDIIDHFFTPGEVSEIWITFPDPRPKEGQEKHRLTHPRYLFLYNKFLAANSLIHLKTDSVLLFEYTLELFSKHRVEVVASTADLYNSTYEALHFGIKTKYEAMFLAEGKKICYIQFRLHHEFDPYIKNGRYIQPQLV